MAITKQKKAEIIESLKDIFKDSNSVAFVNFKGLSVTNADKMRKKLRESGVGYTVAKKTLTKFVLGKESNEGTQPSFDGELAITYGKDLIAPAREIFAFQKEFENRVSIVGGIFDGKYMSKEEMTEIASIPPMQTLRAQFVNLINSPIEGFVMALDQIAKSKE